MFARTMICSARRASPVVNARRFVVRATGGLLGDHLTGTRLAATALESFDQRVQCDKTVERKPVRHRVRFLIRPGLRHRGPLVAAALHSEHPLPPLALHQLHGNPPPGQRVKRMRHDYPARTILGNGGTMTYVVGCGQPA